MDDWYVTRALMNGTRAIYMDIATHFVNVNGEEDLIRLNNQKSARNSAEFPIFGHFRPAERYSEEQLLSFAFTLCFIYSIRFPLERRLKEWDLIRQMRCAT